MNHQNIPCPMEIDSISRSASEERQHKNENKHDVYENESERYYSGWLLKLEDETPEEFVRSFPPSQQRGEVFWIGAKIPLYEERAEEIEVAQLQWQALVDSNKKIDKDDIKTIARETGCLTGKWMLFIQPSKVDEVWLSIVRALCDCCLGDCVKVNPKNHPSRSHLICVYTNDFTDEEDVFRVRSALRNLGFRNRLNYKPDIYTHLGIYQNNQWGLKPSFYSS
mmetsp:Transcript_34801/g.44390  ORF Transcript_34801/g.44390 Transcript_34801/m.44390 type:complete len:223 (+) Transcript_34801:79-747(+)